MAEVCPSETDFSEGPSTDIKSTELKKERIRDNQRRSRARRQEHLADLEKRFANAQATVRQAEMQRTVLQDARIENTRLRDLLRIVGVDDVLTQSYIKQGAHQAQHAVTSRQTTHPRLAIQRTDKRRVERTQSSPSPESLALNKLDLAPEANWSGFSSSSLPSDYPLYRSQMLPMPTHMLHDAQLHHSVFRTVSPQWEQTYSSADVLSSTVWQDLY